MCSGIGRTKKPWQIKADLVMMHILYEMLPYHTVIMHDSLLHGSIEHVLCIENMYVHINQILYALQEVPVCYCWTQFRSSISTQKLLLIVK